MTGLQGRLREGARSAWRWAGSMETAIASLVLLMAVVVICTLDQVPMGTFRAVEEDIRSFFVWRRFPGTETLVPVFPGGGLVGTLLLAGLVVNFFDRFRWEARKGGILLAHGGLVLLVFGEFVTGFFAVETQMAIEEGQTMAYTESLRDLELAVIDATDPAFDAVTAVPARLLEGGGEFRPAGWPFALRVKAWHRNADLQRAQPGLPPSWATQGVGTGLAVVPLPPVSKDDEMDASAALLEVDEDGASRGVWLVSNALGAPQTFSSGGRTWRLELRRKRYYLPYSITLRDFRREMYPNTDIPRHFSSRVRLDNPATGESREVLISMNEPLRYEGKAFFQASFGKDDTLSVLQVVDNPGWMLPYLACALAGAGMLLQFLLSLKGFRGFGEARA